MRHWVPAPLLAAKRRLQTAVDLRRSVRRVRDLGPVRSGNEAYQMAVRYRGCGDFSTISAIQDEGEVSRLLDRLTSEGVRNVCEIGSYLGGTLFMMTRVLPDDATLISVDWPGAEQQLPYPASRKQFHERFARAEQRVHVVYGDSKDAATLGAVTTMLGGRLLDFLLVDGDHSLAGVETDFRLYSPLVRPGGLIALHDIIPHDTEDFGVSEFWRQLVLTCSTEEIVSPQRRNERRGYGFGLVRWQGARAT